MPANSENSAVATGLEKVSFQSNPKEGDFKGFGIVNKSEIDVFLELFCSFHDPADVGNLISGSSAFSKTS